MNNKQLKDRNIRLMWFKQNRGDGEKENANLFIKNLAESITQQDLSDKFSVYGSIVSTKLVTYRDGKSKGYGYVQFENEEDAQEAIAELNGSNWNGKSIYVGVFQKKSERIQGPKPTNNI